MPIDNSDTKEVEQRKTNFEKLQDFVNRHTVTAASTTNYVYRNPPVRIRYGQNGQRDVVVTEDENGIHREIPAPLEYRWANYGNPDGIGQAIDAHNDGNAREILNNEPIRIHWNEPGYVAQYQEIPNENQDYRQFLDAMDHYLELQRTANNGVTLRTINFNEPQVWPNYENLVNGVWGNTENPVVIPLGTIEPILPMLEQEPPIAERVVEREGEGELNVPEMINQLSEQTINAMADRVRQEREEQDRYIMYGSIPDDPIEAERYRAAFREAFDGGN